MPNVNIFISYRRDDASGHAGRLCDRLEDYFPGCVFMDVTGITPGTDFVRALEQKIASCQVLIVVIGRSWLSIMRERAGRDEPDHARAEVATALRKGTTVIPVLVQGARMPSAALLPADLKPLATRHALEITEPDFRSDVRRLVEAIERLFSPPRQTRREPEFLRPPERAGLPLWLKLGLGLGAATLVAGFAVFAIIAASVKPQNANTQPTANGAHGGLAPNTSATTLIDTDPKPKPTPTPSPSPDFTPPDGADFFSPPGTWLIAVQTANGPVSGTYRLYPNNQMEFAGGVFHGSGTWGYDDEESSLVISGRNNYGAGFQLVLVIGDLKGGAYQFSSTVGPGTMRRLQ